MTKKKSKTTEEYLKGVIRSQRAELKNLKKQLSRKQKREYQYEDLEEQLVETFIKEEFEEVLSLEKERCPKCSGELEVTDLTIRQIYLCSSCNYRTVKKVPIKNGPKS